MNGLPNALLLIGLISGNPCVADMRIPENPDVDDALDVPDIPGEQDIPVTQACSGIVGAS